MGGHTSVGILQYLLVILRYSLNTSVFTWNTSVFTWNTSVFTLRILRYSVFTPTAVFSIHTPLLSAMFTLHQKVDFPGFILHMGL